MTGEVFIAVVHDVFGAFIAVVVDTGFQTSL